MVRPRTETLVHERSTSPWLHRNTSLTAAPGSGAMAKSRAPSASPSVMQSPLRAPPPTWSSSPGAQQYPSQQYGSGYHGLL